ncbi:MAG: squalene/phytoene synthase family protein [Gammaproteobacteria bacterium]
MTTSGAFTEYRERIAPRGSSLYYSLLFTDEEKRLPIIALHAFGDELAKITTQQTEKSILQAKLQWWQQEWQRTFDGQAQHPITKIFDSRTLSVIPPVLLQEWIDSAILKLECDHLCTEKDLDFFCYRERGILAIVSAYLLGFKQQTSLRGVQDLAESITLIEMTVNLAKQLHRGWCFLPLDWLEQHQVSEEHLQSKLTAPEVKAVLQQLLNYAHVKFNNGLEKIAKEDKSSLLPIIIQATLADKLRQAIIKADFSVLREQISLAPLRKLFTAIRMYWRD